MGCKNCGIVKCYDHLPTITLTPKDPKGKIERLKNIAKEFTDLHDYLTLSVVKLNSKVNELVDYLNQSEKKECEYKRHPLCGKRVEYYDCSRCKGKHIVGGGYHQLCGDFYLDGHYKDCEFINK